MEREGRFSESFWVCVRDLERLGRAKVFFVVLVVLLVSLVDLSEDFLLLGAEVCTF